MYAVLGVKLAKLPLLKGLFDEESKQKQKLSRATLDAGADNLVEWLKLIPDLQTYTSQIQESGTTGAQLAQMESDAPLIALGMNSEVDRKRLLLLLARVRSVSKNERALLCLAESAMGRSGCARSLLCSICSSLDVPPAHRAERAFPSRQ